MKKLTTYTLLALLSFSACTDQKQKETQLALNDLESWMDSVRQDSQHMNLKAWQKIELEYVAVASKIDSSADKLSSEAKEDYEALEEDFNDLQKKYKASIDNTQVKAHEEMMKIEAWMEETTEKMETGEETAIEEIEADWNSFKSNFTEGIDDLTDETKEKWNTLENRVNQWIEYDLKQNLK